MNLCYKIYAFSELSNRQLYAIMRLRQEVFVVEQNCPYLDADGKDPYALHLLGMKTPEADPLSYLRIIASETHGNAVHIGRVLCHSSLRGSGHGRELMKRGLATCKDQFPGLAVKISAQQYLVKFYHDLGFSISSEPYDEDGIPHIEMTCNATTL